MSTWFGGFTGGEQASTSTNLQQPGTSQFGSPGNHSFAVGSIVEYYSASSGTWIPAQVRAHRPDGSYDLDCKPGVPAERIRAAQPSQQTVPIDSNGGATHEIGAVVEYYSESQGNWIPARVLGYDASTGCYNLDCKPQVPPNKIRALTPGTADALRPQSEQYGGAMASSSRPGTSAAVATFSNFGPPERLGGSMPSSMTAGAAPSQDAPLQLIRVSKRANGNPGGGAWHFEVDEQAIKALEAYGQRPVAICTVCGPYRTGKSYLLNLLLGRIQQGATQFRVGSTTKACTEGLWMWGAGDNAGVRSDGPALIFMDCEGFGSTEADKTRDAKLMSLCLLISSVFLLNTKGVLNESLFNALSLVCNLADHVEEHGSEASKPALMWMLRDFILELRDPETDKILSPDEYIEKALHSRPTAGGERSQAAREVRETLLKCFPRRHCHTLVTPIVDEEKLQNLAEVPYSELRPNFRKEFEAAQGQIFNLVRERPKTVGGKAIGGAALATLIRRLVDSLNANQALNVMNAWDGVQHGACQTLAEELKKAAVDELRKVKNNGAPLPIMGGQPLPVSDESLQKALKEGRRALWEQWRSRAVGDDAVKSDYWEDIEGALEVEERELERQNVILAEQQLATAGAEWAAWLVEEKVSAADPRSEALSQLLERGVPLKPAARFVREALNSSRMARIRWDGEIHAKKAEIQLLSENLEAKKSAEAAGANDQDAALESTRELGRLQGQVNTMQEQAREAIQREKMMRDQVMEAEEATRKEQRAQVEVRQTVVAQERTIRDLEESVRQLREAAEKHPSKEADAEDGREQAPAAGKKGKKPKCGCTVM